MGISGPFPNDVSSRALAVSLLHRRASAGLEACDVRVGGEQQANDVLRKQQEHAFAVFLEEGQTWVIGIISLRGCGDRVVKVWCSHGHTAHQSHRLSQAGSGETPSRTQAMTRVCTSSMKNNGHGAGSRTLKMTGGDCVACGAHVDQRAGFPKLSKSLGPSDGGELGQLLAIKPPE
jgi:hypothetical protein